MTNRHRTSRPLSVAADHQGGNAVAAEAPWRRNDALSVRTYPRQKSIQHFKDQIRQRTRRKAPVTIPELVAEINPVLRGWGLYYHKAHVRKLFAQLDRWILRRIWAQRFKRWRCR